MDEGFDGCRDAGMKGGLPQERMGRKQKKGNKNRKIWGKYLLLPLFLAGSPAQGKG
jgi:hypothetical protein